MVLASAEVWTGQAGHYELAAGVPHRQPAPITIGDKELPVVARAGVSGGTWLDIWLPQLVGPGGAAATRVAPIAHAGELLGLIVSPPRATARRSPRPRTTCSPSSPARSAWPCTTSSSTPPCRPASRSCSGATTSCSSPGPHRRRRRRRAAQARAQPPRRRPAAPRRARRQAAPRPGRGRGRSRDAVAMIDEIKGDVQEAIAGAALARARHLPAAAGVRRAGRGAAGSRRPGRRCRPPSTGRASAATRPDIEAAIYFCCWKRCRTPASTPARAATVAVSRVEDRRHARLRGQRRRCRASTAPQPAATGTASSTWPTASARFGGTLAVRSAPGRGHDGPRHVPAVRRMSNRHA